MLTCSELAIDACVLAVALADDAADGDMARTRLGGETLGAPDLVDLEVISVLRGQPADGHLDTRRAGRSSGSTTCLHCRCCGFLHGSFSSNARSCAAT
jgi:hypothetical protein